MTTLTADLTKPPLTPPQVLNADMQEIVDDVTALYDRAHLLWQMTVRDLQVADLTRAERDALVTVKSNALSALALLGKTVDALPWSTARKAAFRKNAAQEQM